MQWLKTIDTKSYHHYELWMKRRKKSKTFFLWLKYICIHWIDAFVIGFPIVCSLSLIECKMQRTKHKEKEKKKNEWRRLKHAIEFNCRMSRSQCRVLTSQIVKIATMSWVPIIIDVLGLFSFFSSSSSSCSPFWKL